MSALANHSADRTVQTKGLVLLGVLMQGNDEALQVCDIRIKGWKLGTHQCPPATVEALAAVLPTLMPCALLILEHMHDCSRS
jgi:hypothetical protein